MYRNKFEIYSIAGLVFTSIWLVIALLFFFFGLAMFISSKEESVIQAWFIWGLFCVIPVIIPTLKFVFGMTRDNAREGERHVTYTITSDSITSSNDGCLYGIIGFVLSAAAAVAAGPIVLGFYMVLNILAIIRFVSALVASRRSGGDSF